MGLSFVTADVFCVQSGSLVLAGICVAFADGQCFRRRCLLALSDNQIPGLFQWGKSGTGTSDKAVLCGKTFRTMDNVCDMHLVSVVCLVCWHLETGFCRMDDVVVTKKRAI